MIMNGPKQTSHLKREILVRLIKAFYTEDFAENARLIPYQMRPKDYEAAYRCCVYKERAILRDRTIAGLGLSIEETDESVHMAELANQALKREKPEESMLTVLQTACKGCVPSRFYVTDLCQGCVARPCISTCRFGAISIKDGKSKIDTEKCKNCGMCAQVCPYQAIMKVIVPCENACPVGAIEKDDNGRTRIDFEKCISCGKCISACPFGAVHKKSQIIDVLKHIKQGKKVIAMVAPSMFGQLPCSPEQLKSAILELGFSDVYEVAQGADVTSKTEAAEFEERMENGEEFMTTSCCAAYNELVEKHLPEIKPYRSTTHTPMYYTAEIVKKENPDCISVFFSPCVAKRKEALNDKNVDYVLNYDEIGAWFVAKGIKVEECEASSFKTEASAEARNYAVTGGVANAVKTLLPDDIPAYPVTVDGLSKNSIRDLKKYAKNGVCELGNLIEVMACPGGCLGGSSTLNAYKPASKQLAKYVADSKPSKEIFDN